MSLAERIWWVLSFGAVGWYLTVTVVVAVRGVHDIRTMLKHLGKQQLDAEEESSGRGKISD